LNGLEGENYSEQLTDEEQMQFLTFGRVYSGTVHKGQKLYMLQPRYDPRNVPSGDEPSLPEHVSSYTVQELFIFMGKESHQLKKFLLVVCWVLPVRKSIS